MTQSCIPIRMRLGATAVCALSLAASSGSASASLLFSDDFEAYAAGGDLLGQGGWFGSDGPMPVGAVGPMPTQVLDGIAAPSPATQHFAGHAVAAPAPGVVTVMDFDALASARSANSWAGLSSDATGSLDSAVIWDFDRSQWQIEIRQPGVATSAFAVALGPDQRHVEFTVVRRGERWYLLRF